MVDKKQDLKGMDLFIDIIEKTYLGTNFQYSGETFRLTPTLVKPADFHKKPAEVQTAYDALLKTLDPAFKTLATSEVYRANTGWITKAVNGYKGHKIRKITVGEEVYLLPNISKQATVGIDTSGCRDNLNTVMVVCSIPDFEGAYLWLEKHLALPKDVKQNEFHWNKLGQSYRKRLLDNFELVLSVCCDCLLVVKTNVFLNRKGKMLSVFANLVEGCFSGFENVPSQAAFRAELKQRFFRAVNRVEVHCDDDFLPLRPDQVVRLLVKTLAKQWGYFENYTPLLANLYSHESKPIQIADIIAGMVKTRIESKENLLLRPLPFDARKLANYSNHLPKAYVWLSEKEEV
ncbi:MAG: hypothetical protein FWG55_01215 [Candidatus Bathyarchaeota archaeon]|nr:hypothetical protein [Candidatus Termiticorpusculum sp.]